MIDPATAEAAAVLRWSTGAARERIDLAGTLVEDLPGVFEALERGLIDAGKAREIMVGTCELAPETRVWLAGQAVDYATSAYPRAGAGVAGPAGRPDRPGRPRTGGTAGG